MLFADLVLLVGLNILGLTLVATAICLWRARTLQGMTDHFGTMLIVVLILTGGSLVIMGISRLFLP